MKKALMLAAVLATALTASSALADKKVYYFSVGCYPDYKLHRISCDVGTSWKVCAAKFCNAIAAPGGRDAAERARKANPSLNIGPKLLSPLPQEAR